MTEFNLSIIIVSYNVEQFLLKCIKSIYDNYHDSFEIIIIDNNSSDNTLISISERFHEVKLIKNSRNVGFPAANNQGFQIAKGKYILMLNPDTEIIGDSISKLIKFLDTDSNIALIGPKLINSDYSLQYSAWRFPKIRYLIAEMFYLNKLISTKCYSDRDLSKPLESDSLSGAAMLFRKELFCSVGMLDEKLFWIEDIDFCYRIRKKGFRIIYYPESEIIHHIGKSAVTNYKISASNQIFNKIKFYKKHNTKAETIIVILISLVNVILRFSIFLILSPFNVTYYRKAKAYWFTLPRVFNPPIEI